MKPLFGTAVLVTLLSLPANCLASPANTDYTPSEVLNHITASQKAISNATFECVWKTRMDGLPLPDGRTVGSPKWEQQTFYWDSPGRRRNLLHGGPLSQDGKQMEDEDPSSTDRLFNGEIVVNTSSHPKWTRDGLKPASAKDAVGYSSVIVGDAAAPIRSGLESERNPLEYMRNVVLSDLTTTVKNGNAATQSADNGRVAVEIKHTGSDTPYVKTLISLAPNHNWAIESVRSYRNDGKLAREVVCDYKEQADGLWVPVRLRHTHWGDRSQTDAPYFEWSFETTKARFNDPSFDPHVFDVRLKSDTAVSDTRYGIAYRVGKEGATASDLDRNAANVPGAKPPSLVGHALPDLTASGLKAADAPASEPVIVLLIDAEQRPSRRTLEVLTDQATGLKAKPVAVVVLEVGSMTESDYAGWLQGATLPFLITRLKGNAANGRSAWGARSLPWLILADKNHRVVADGFPIEDLDAKLKELAN
jgi:hypothetical protein